MVKVYVYLINAGLKKIEDVPENLREEVKKALKK